jgi:hypothetical protein
MYQCRKILNYIAIVQVAIKLAVPCGNSMHKCHCQLLLLNTITVREAAACNCLLREIRVIKSPRVQANVHSL